ncbi:MAG: TraR/DksA C4-type zinc finger protein [Ktedonobacterales bacterium]
MNSEYPAEALAELRATLEAKRSHFQTRLTGLRAAEGASDDPNAISRADDSGDSGDDSVDLEELDRENAESEDVEANLSDVNAALARMDAGTYGACAECGRPIPLARLHVLPEARYDAEHAALHETGR